MSTPPPEPSDEAGRLLAPRIHPGFQLVIGLVLGTAVSAAIWILGWDAFEKSNAYQWFALGTIFGLKIFVGIGLLFFRRWRFVGIGLLISLAMGFLIFFGTCFAHL